MLTCTSAFHKINRLTRKIKIIQGGQGASKTFSICQLLLLKSIRNPNNVATIVTATYPQLKDGVINDMEIICRNAGINFSSFYNKSEKNLKLTNGAVIQFRNLDAKDFHASKGSRRNDLFVNEANRVSWVTLENMWTRTSDNIYVDFNPDHEFWVHERFLKAENKEVDFIILTYKDNEMIPEGERKEIELRRNNEMWWRIYGEGKLGVYSDRQVYQYEFIDEIPATAKRIPSGQDYGQSPDPTTHVDLWVDGANLYADEVFTENNLLLEHIPGAERRSILDQMEICKIEKGRLIIGDSENAVAIRTIRNAGYNIRGVVKYKGSVNDGISILKSYNLFISKRSVNLKKGIESWHFKVNDNGDIIPEPDGHEPDQLAAIRYVMIMKRWW